MNKIIRTLTFSENISLIAMDCTDMVNEAIKIHSLSAPAAVVFGKAMMAMTYMASWLKDPSGELSVNIKGNGASGTVVISGDSLLNMRGSIEHPDVHCSENGVIGSEGYMTVVRDDGYSQPFVGTVPIHEGRVERLFTEYYAISEQLPTAIYEDVIIDEHKACECAFAVFLQAMPSAPREITLKVAETVKKISTPVKEIKAGEMEKWVKNNFDAGEITSRNAEYKCKCSKEKISGLLLSMQKSELDGIIKEKGKINVHCHYCNTDYVFTQADVDALFEKKER